MEETFDLSEGIVERTGIGIRKANVKGQSSNKIQISKFKLQNLIWRLDFSIHLTFKMFRLAFNTH